MALQTPYARATMMHVDANGVLRQRALGTSAGRERDVRWCIQRGKQRRRMRDMVRSVAVVAV